MPSYIKLLLIPVSLLNFLLFACVPSPQATSTDELSPPPENNLSTETVKGGIDNTRLRALVTEIADGDTIKGDIGRTIFKLRYIGINAPELNSTNAATRDLAHAATEMNRQLVGGKYVELEKDISETDKYDRLLRYVYVNGTMVNAELVKCGLARSIAYPPDTKYQALLNSLQDNAKSSGMGIWNPENN
jgi:micrococcal nuclease